MATQGMVVDEHQYVRIKVTGWDQDLVPLEVRRRTEFTRRAALPTWKVRSELRLHPAGLTPVASLLEFAQGFELD